MRRAGMAFLLWVLAGPALAGEGVYSLDQCADQFVLALADRQDIRALSYRSDDADSYLRHQAGGLPRGRAGLEPVLASRAGVVVRYWGGDARLTAALERRGVRTVTIDDATSFEGVRANVRKVSAALGHPDRGERLVARMDATLARAGRGSESRSGRPAALYLTSGGFTAGPRTLIGAMIEAAGFHNAEARPFFSPVSLERLVVSPPAALVLGYFDTAALAAQRWAFGRHQVVRRTARRRALAALPSSILGCPAWFAADGSLALSGAAP